MFLKPHFRFCASRIRRIPSFTEAYNNGNGKPIIFVSGVANFGENFGEKNSYEREQLAAKLQNLKTQFRNRKIAVDEGQYINFNY